MTSLAAFMIQQHMQTLAAELHAALPSKGWHVAICAVMSGATDDKGAIVVTDDAKAVIKPITSALEHMLESPTAGSSTAEVSS